MFFITTMQKLQERKDPINNTIHNTWQYNESWLGTGESNKTVNKRVSRMQYANIGRMIEFALC